MGRANERTGYGRMSKWFSRGGPHKGWIGGADPSYCPGVDLLHRTPRTPHKVVALSGGPLDGEFHRYSLAASSGELGQHAPLGYTGTVEIEVAGFAPARGDHTEWILPES